MNKTEKQIVQTASKFAHRDNDCAVMAAYGFPTTKTKPECVVHLFTLY